MASAGETSLLANIVNLKSQLSDIIEPEFGLLDHLLRLDVLTRRQYNIVRAGDKAACERSEVLLDLLVSEEQCGKFLEALRITAQQHIVNLITENGDIGPAFGDARPLDIGQMRRLSLNGIHLLDRMKTDVAFVTELANAGCITWPQRQHILDLIHERDRNDKLLEFITRRSVADYEQFIKVLSKEQAYLVPFLVTNGAVVAVDAELDCLSVDDAELEEGSADDVTQTEDKIVSQWREVSSDDRSQLREQFDEILRPLGLQTRLLVVEKANSLALLFTCLTLSALMSLRDQWRSQRLRDIVHSLLRLLSAAAHKVYIKRLTWPLADYERCLELLHSLQDREDSSRSVDLSIESCTVKTSVSDLPVEMLEAVLMRAYLLLYQTDFEADDDRRPYKSAKSSVSECRAFTLLASVCSYWRHTLVGWPDSPTCHWVRHKLKKLIERSCHLFERSVEQQHVYESPDGRWVAGVTQLHDVVYIVCTGSSTIIRFDAVTHQRLNDISVKDLRLPRDITACEHTSSVYVSDYLACVWRLSSDGEDVKLWLQRSPSDTFKPYVLSVTSSRLLVTSDNTKQLRQFDEVGDELRRVDLPDYMKPLHAVESLTGTFIVSHENTQLKQRQVSEVNSGGQVLRQFSGSHLLPLGDTPHIAVDSQGNIFVADCGTSRILLLDSELALRRVIIDEHQPSYRLCYSEHSGQLLVGFYDSEVAVFDVLRR